MIKDQERSQASDLPPGDNDGEQRTAFRYDSTVDQAAIVDSDVGSEHSLARLAFALPPASDALAGDDSDSQCRAALSFLVERAIAHLHDPAPGQTYSVDLLTCPNCGNPDRSDRSPYCSDACRAQAAFVRQFRTGLRD